MSTPASIRASLAAALLVLLASGARPVDARAEGRWPVDHPLVLSGFRPAEPDWTAGHRGVDLRSGTGETIRAIAGGRVAFAGSVAGKPVVTVLLEGAGAVRVTYEPVVAAVEPGQRVRSGDPIGVLAASGGHCGGTAGCLHVGVRTVAGYVDPLRLMGRRPAVLKPARSVRSGPRVGEGKGRPEPLHRDMRVSLRGRQG